jgi:hypothetical protein
MTYIVEKLKLALNLLLKTYKLTKTQNNKNEWVGV